MNVLEKYYEENLYPLQNGVLNIVKKSGTPFFLTGGTALSRYYVHHRYSDDLDLFVINDPDYSSHVTTLLKSFVDEEVDGCAIVADFDAENLVRVGHGCGGAYCGVADVVRVAVHSCAVPGLAGEGGVE